MHQILIEKNYRKIIGFILVFAFTFFIPIAPFIAAADDARVAELKKKAREEGKLVFYTSLALQDAMDLENKFKKKYPFFKTQINRLSNTKLLNRVLAEHRAKKRLVDVITCKGDAVHLLQKKGVLAKYPSPERKFYGDAFKDKEGYWTDAYPTVHTLVYNTRMVAPDETPTRFEGMLNPKWKGMLGINSNNYMWLEVIMQIMGKEKGMKFLEDLAKQNPMVRAGSTLNITLVAAGELAMVVSVNANLVEKHKAKGAPVEWAKIKPYYGDLHPAALVAKAPHPNAGKILIDYILSQTGQELMIEFGKIPARRGLQSKLIRSEEITPIEPALGEKTNYYMGLMRKIFAK
jgi:ABC-type Fe3+ transport system substrate-binding protein